ncbi:hypothetical protein [Aquimarina spongiae]|uniref:Uncharacterized protein n=1 Tax=Aquimarina spongiae TaxID=570521 RepID=A0A1M6AUY3_9FLAO|nr:hypothetical protein [Aquimarina spongiae]SHI40221.1 hypothetical protein SAMN04488508_101487 [Aquimarina spongiae]
MKNKKALGLDLKKIVISELQAKQVKGGGAKNGQYTRISDCKRCGQAPSQRPTCQHE